MKKGFQRVSDSASGWLHNSTILDGLAIWQGQVQGGQGRRLVGHGPCRCPDALPRPLMHPSHREPGRWGLGEDDGEDGENGGNGGNGESTWTGTV